MEYKYVWLNLETGEFSNSWDEETHNAVFTENDALINSADNKTWKLIKYQCINDEKFELYDSMKIVTNIKKSDK